MSATASTAHRRETDLAIAAVEISHLAVSNADEIKRESRPSGIGDVEID
jgi:hypothetical protein